MINKLRRRFILIAMGSFALVVAIIIGAINTVNMMQINSQTKGILQLIDAYDGDIPIKNERPNTDFGIAVTEEFRFSTRYFTVRYDKNNTVTQINTCLLYTSRCV